MAEKTDLRMVSINKAEEFLSHFGIKGMRWGVRRTDAQLAKASTITPRKGESQDAARARTTLSTIKSTKSTTSVSDSDLQHLVNRISLEKRYSEITSGKSSTSVTKSVDKKVKTLLAIGDTMNKAYTFANSPSGRILANQLGLYKAGSGKHAGLPKNVIDLPSTPYIGKHRK